MRGMATNRASNRDFFMVIYVFLCLELQEGGDAESTAPHQEERCFFLNSTGGIYFFAKKSFRELKSSVLGVSARAIAAFCAAVIVAAPLAASASI